MLELRKPGDVTPEFIEGILTDRREAEIAESPIFVGASLQRQSGLMHLAAQATGNFVTSDTAQFVELIDVTHIATFLTLAKTAFDPNDPDRKRLDLEMPRNFIKPMLIDAITADMREHSFRLTSPVISVVAYQSGIGFLAGLQSLEAENFDLLDSLYDSAYKTYLSTYIASLRLPGRNQGYVMGIAEKFSPMVDIMGEGFDVGEIVARRHPVWNDIYDQLPSQHQAFVDDALDPLRDLRFLGRVRFSALGVLAGSDTTDGYRRAGFLTHVFNRNFPLNPGAI